MATSFSFKPIVSSGLVLCLDAGNTKSYPGSGTTWSDLTSNGNNGTLVNGGSGLTYSNTNGGVISFDGSNDYIQLSNGLLSGSGDFTVNQWIKWTSGDYGHIFGNYPSGNLQVGYGPKIIYLYLGVSSGTTCYLGTPPYTTILPQFTSNNVMVTTQRSGNTLLLYLNGLLQKTGSTTDSIGLASAQFRIGTNTSNTEQFSGSVYQTQLYNRALTAAEVLQNYNATKNRFV